MSRQINPCTGILQTLGVSGHSNVKANQSLYRHITDPGGFRTFRLSRHSAHDGSKVVSHVHRPPLSPGNNPGPPFLLEPESTAGPMTLSGIEHATFQFVATAPPRATSKAL